MTRKNNYLAQLQQRREEATRNEQAAAHKDPADMTEAERKAEIERLEREIRESEQEAIRVGREELAGQSRPLTRIFKRARPSWK
jgi:hypothetical protein